MQQQEDTANKPSAPRGKGDPERLGKERIGKLLVEFSVPAIMMMVFNSLYNIVDTVFLQIAVPGVGGNAARVSGHVRAHGLFGRGGRGR